MTTALQFRTEQAATSILRNAKAKPDWKQLDVATLPSDLRSIAEAMQSLDAEYRTAKLALEAALSDKAVIPTGKRIIATTGRVTGNTVAPLLYAIVDGSSTKSTPIVSFDQFIKG